MGRALEYLLQEARLIESLGPWPFVTRRTFRQPDGDRVIVEARHRRKNLFRAEMARLPSWGALLLRGLWLPGELNWWIGAVFAAGSFLFCLGSVLFLCPALARALSLDAREVNAVFFAGSIPFTTAGYLQLYQAANAPCFADWNAQRERRRLFGWRPNEIGWLACALQFVGTVLFNVNTFDGMLPGLGWRGQDALVWTPDLTGSILFLVSGYLFYLEVGHAHWSWKPRDLSWLLTFANLLGCVGFMLSALLAFVPAHSAGNPAASVAFTLLGAIGFLIGSLLMLPEAARAERASGVA